MTANSSTARLKDRVTAFTAGATAAGMVCGVCRAAELPVLSGETATRPPVACGSQVSIERTTYEGFTNAWRMRNAEVELVVVPEIGRITRYGLIGGSNVLWSGRAADGTVWLVGAWKNWGGDKVWVWPQTGWPNRAGRSWPPPGDGPVQRWDASLAGGRLLMTGPEIEGYGCRAVRELALAPTGTAVTLVTRLEAIGAACLDGLAVWSVTQIPAAPEVAARLSPDAVGEGVHDPSPGWPAPQREGGWLRFRRPGDRGCKSFVDADRWTVAVGDRLFVQELLPGVGRAYRPGERAQLFTSPDAEPWRPASIGPVTELEFTSPPAGPGQTPVLTVVWSFVAK